VNINDYEMQVAPTG